jgi:hypothetical protein
MPAKVLAIGAAVAFAAGCSTETHTVVVTENVCATYGFSTASPQYRECVARETAARALGRAQPGYSSARLMLDSQTACQSYGLVPYTDMYERCVRREYAYRTPA